MVPEGPKRGPKMVQKGPFSLRMPLRARATVYILVPISDPGATQILYVCRYSKGRWDPRSPLFSVNKGILRGRPPLLNGNIGVPKGTSPFLKVNKGLQRGLAMSGTSLREPLRARARVYREGPMTSRTRSGPPRVGSGPGPQET